MKIIWSIDVVYLKNLVILSRFMTQFIFDLDWVNQSFDNLLVGSQLHSNS